MRASHDASSQLFGSAHHDKWRYSVDIYICNKYILYGYVYIYVHMHMLFYVYYHRSSTGIGCISEIKKSLVKLCIVQ